jgi:hypothetical protein
MRFHDIMGDAQPKPGTLSTLLRRKKRLQDFVFDFISEVL